MEIYSETTNSCLLLKQLLLNSSSTATIGQNIEQDINIIANDQQISSSSSSISSIISGEQQMIMPFDDTDETNCSLLLNAMMITNDYSSASSSSLEFPNYIRTTATIVCAIVLILGTIGNLLVPLVVIKTKELRNSTNLFLINLSVADLLVLIVCMPTVLIELHSKPEIWQLGEVMCKTVPFVELVVAHGSILTILAISFERYYAICKPLKAGYKCTLHRAVVIIIVVWSVAFVATIPVLFGTELSEARYIDGSLVLVCLTQANTLWQKLYFLASMAAFFWAPLCMLLVIYSVITKRLILDDRIQCSSGDSSNNGSGGGNNSCSVGRIACSNSEHTQMRARRQVVFMLAAVVTCFFICLLPFRLLTLWLIVSSEDQIKALSMEAFYSLLYFCRIMLYVNSMLNPCLYAVVSSKFRDAFVIVLCCRQRTRLLNRHNTFNTTTSSDVFRSLKNSLHRTLQTSNSETPPTSMSSKCDMNSSSEKELKYIPPHHQHQHHQHHQHLQHLPHHHHHHNNSSSSNEQKFDTCHRNNNQFEHYVVTQLQESYV